MLKAGDAVRREAEIIRQIASEGKRIKMEICVIFERDG